MPDHNELLSSPSAGESHQLALWASPEGVYCADASLAPANTLAPWVIFHVPHDSTLIPQELRSQFALTDAELAAELIKMTDHLTLALFASGVPGQQVIKAAVSRLVVDVERFEDDRQETMARRGMGAVYLKTSSGQALRHPLAAQARRALIAACYRPHHARLTAATQRCLDAFGQALLIDAHSFPSRPLPYEAADSQLQRPDICIGTDRFHTPQALEEAFVKAFEADGFRVAVNSPFSGALVPARYHRQDARVSAVMVEVNRSLYLDEATGQGSSGFAQMSGRIKRCISAAIEAWACAGAAQSPRVPPAAPAAAPAGLRRLPTLQGPMPPFEAHRRLCFYPSSGDRLLWAVMRLDCDLFVMADQQRQAVSWQRIEADFQKRHLPVELLHRSAQHLCFRSANKTAWIFFEDNNAALRRLSLARLTIDHFVGICDGCAEGGNHECVHERPFLSHVLQLAVEGMAYTTDHSRPLEERPYGWGCGTPAQPRFRTALAWRDFPPPPEHQRRTGPEWALVPEATRFVLQGVLVAPGRQRRARLRIHIACPQFVARQGLEAVHQVLHQRAAVIAAFVLPVLLAALGNVVNGRVALWRTGLTGRPVNGALDGRNERQGGAPGNGRAGDFSVVGAIAADNFYLGLWRQLRQQLGQHAGVIDVAVRHQHGAHLSGFRVQRQVHFAPAAPFAVAMLAYLPLALAKELQAGAVDQQMHRLARVAQHRQAHPQRLGPSAQRAVVGHRQTRQRQVLQAGGEALKRPQRQAVHRLERQEHLDHCVAVRLRAPALAWRLKRWREHPFVHPDSHISPLDQARVVLGPVLDPVNAFGLAGQERVFWHVRGKST